MSITWPQSYARSRNPLSILVDHDRQQERHKVLSNFPRTVSHMALSIMTSENWGCIKKPRQSPVRSHEQQSVNRLCNHTGEKVKIPDFNALRIHIEYRQSAMTFIHTTNCHIRLILFYYFIIYYLLFIIYYLLFIIYYLLFIIYYLYKI